MDKLEVKGFDEVYCQQQIVEIDGKKQLDRVRSDIQSPTETDNLMTVETQNVVDAD